MISLLVLASITVACTTVSSPSEEDRNLSFGCDDIVVIGRLQNGDYEHVEIENDLLGHGWISAKLSVRRIVKGEAPSLIIPVTYFAHTYMREDRDFMFVLSKDGNGTHHVEAAQLMSARPRLAPRCR